MPPAIFLFLTGITLAFLMHSFERKGVSRRDRITGTLRRAGYLFGIAMLFRLELWLFSWPSPWTNLLKVDILNCMGFGIALMSTMALFTTAQRARIGAALGLAIACASPLVSQINWSAAPWIVKAYLAPDYNYFSFFPWAAYMAFGLSAGSLIRLLKEEHYDRAMQWCALLGIGMILIARYFANLPFSIYSKSEFWLDSPAQVLIKLGVTLVILAVAFVWTQYSPGASGPGWSLGAPVRHYVSAHLLGAHRAGIRAVAAVVQESSGCAADGAGVGRADRADALVGHGEDLSQRCHGVCLGMALGLVREAGSGACRLGSCDAVLSKNHSLLFCAHTGRRAGSRAAFDHRRQ